MTTEEAQKVLDELQEVRPEVLNDKGKRLFEAIMKIADERDELYKKVKKLGKEQQTLIQSRKKWKNRYYKIKAENKRLDQMINSLKDFEEIANSKVTELNPIRISKSKSINK